MEFIQICEYKGEAVTTSRAVAEQFGKQHAHVIRDIENIISQLNQSKIGAVNPENELNQPKFGPVNPENEPTQLNAPKIGAVNPENKLNGLKNQPVKPENEISESKIGLANGTENEFNQLKIEPVKNEHTQPNFGLSNIEEFADRNFILSEYTDTKGETRKQYILTRDGFTLLAMGFTGAKAMQFKVAYINAFNRMESIINGEARLETAKREASRSIEQVNSYAESNSLDSVATDSIEAMRTAYNTGLIAFTRKRTGEKSGSGEVVGVYDDFTVSIYTTELHKLYVNHTGDNIPFNVWIGIVKRKLKYQNNHRDRARLTMSREEANIIL